MSLLDYLIIIIPVAFVMYMAWHSRRYIRSVADFLSAGRICGRYVICVADVANGLAVITLMGYVESQYKTGFGMVFWNNVLIPLTMFMALTGYCTYRFRETKAMSLGQFLEMRYNRPLRIFAASLRSISEMLTNMICPALAARFFIYFFDLPHEITLCGITFPTFVLVVICVLTLSISIICMGGTLALVITDTIQGLMCYPMLVVFTIFVLMTFSWSNEIIPVLSDRVAGESFLNPFDVENLRDFNLFALVVSIFNTILNRASWTGAGNTSAARTPHEQKMAGVLGAWRTGFQSIFYILVALTIITLFNHKNFGEASRNVKVAISNKVAAEVVEDPAIRAKLVERVAALPVNNHTVGVDPALSQKSNIDTPYLETAHKTLLEGEDGNARFQEFRTLYHQLMLPMTMRNVLPKGMLGLFCLLIILMMISTDDTRIYSASLTIAQDVIMPFRKEPFTPQGHIWLLRFVSIGVGVFFLIGSFFMSQLDYINLFVQIMVSIWCGGAGPVMIFGLYSRFGTAAGAFASLFVGMGTSLFGIFVQRNWADLIYPMLKNRGWDVAIGNVLSTISGPFEPYILWRMDAVKCPINSYEFFFAAMLLSLIAYCVVSMITLKEPFNLDRMLHRGKYNLDEEKMVKVDWSVRAVFTKLIGITSEYSRGDRIIAYGIFAYSFVYQFLLSFVAVVIWNVISPWPANWWGTYFLVVSLVVPGIVAGISTVWFSVGGAIDLKSLFRDLRNRKVNHLDDGRVEGNVSLADKAELEAVDAEAKAE